MNEEFVPFELALKLKELGFDLKCLAYYVIGEFEDEPLPIGTVCGPGYGDIHFGVFIPKYQYAADDKLVAAPLWQQAFDWFESKYSLFVDRNMTISANEIVDIEYTIKSINGYQKVEFTEPYSEFDRYKSKIIVLNALLKIIENDR